MLKAKPEKRLCSPPRVGRAWKQVGAALLETLIALTLSTIVVAAMVVLLGNAMGTSTRIIGMTQMTDEMRSVMSMLTRDVRRANYSANSIYCYGHSNCGSTVALQSSGINITNTDSVQCVTYQLDRSYVNASGTWTEVDGNATNDPWGGFRRVVRGGVGVIDMWVGTTDNLAAQPDCSPSVTAGWLEVTNPNAVDIVEFTIGDDQSRNVTLTQQDGSSFTQTQRQLNLAIQGELMVGQRDEWREDTSAMNVRREIADRITVRNDYINYTPAL